MRDMIEQLLDLTRARLGGGLGFIRARRRIDVAEIVGRIADEVRAASPERQVLVSTQGDCHTAADATRLLQLFSNLLSNAIHHGVPGTPVTATVEGGAGEIVVVVRNEGAIRPNVLPRIFDPFHGERSSLSSRGLGLGLFISQQIAAAHGGTIVVASSPETGTAFTVRLPKVEEIDRPKGDAAARRLLIVDDDDDIRDSLREAFEAAGYEARTAVNGEEALRLLKDGSPAPDAVILDLVMPVLDGDRVYRAMKADPALAEIPVIISTSNPSRAPAGVRVLPKPVKLEQLLEMVAEVCGEPLAK